MKDEVKRRSLLNAKYREYLQRHIGNTSVGASTARGMGPKGTIQAAREYLQTVDLRRFRVRSERMFQRRLNKVTEELRQSLPKKARHWGSSRKFLNIFLRGCLYNRYVCEHYKLQVLERWLEVPLDSQVGKGLRKCLPKENVPRWKSVVGITPRENATFQSCAARLAVSEGVCRVHLDLKFWRAPDADPGARRGRAGKRFTHRQT
jgi:hypothetical protein